MNKLDFSFMSPYDAVLEAHTEYINFTIDQRGGIFYTNIYDKRVGYFEWKTSTIYGALEYCNEFYNRSLKNESLNTG